MVVLHLPGLRPSSHGHRRRLRPLRQSLPHSGNERPEEVRDESPQEDAQPIFQPGQCWFSLLFPIHAEMKSKLCIFTASKNNSPFLLSQKFSQI